MWKSALIIFQLFAMIIIFTLGCSNETDTPCVKEDKKTETDSIADNSLFIKDLDALESTTITVRQPASVICLEDGKGAITSDETYMSSELNDESKASAYRLLKETMERYPLKRSFRSLQDDWLLTFFYSISYSRVIDGKKTRIFKVDFYNILTPPPVMEVKHELGGRTVYHDRDIELKTYLFFAQSIESEHPETAKALRKIAKKASCTKRMPHEKLGE